MTPELAAMADAATARALAWPVFLDFRHTGPDHIGVDVTVLPYTRQAHLACVACEQSVVCLNTNLESPSHGYGVTPQQITVSVAAHVRQCHEKTPPVAA